MKPKSFMLIAGEPSGDLLASELVSTIRQQSPDAKFFGAGGSKMAAAGVELAFDMTQHSVTGIPALGKFFKLRELFHRLRSLAIQRKPDVVIGVDYGGFNLRFGHAIKEFVRYDSGDWDPKIVQFVSPQVWASRPKRANLLESDYDLLLSIFPFEKDWYAQHAPKLRVEFVGHPMVERFAQSKVQSLKPKVIGDAPKILLLPGSRRSELQRHLPVMLSALTAIKQRLPDAKAKVVLPDESLVELAKSFGVDCEIQIGDLPKALTETDIALAKTGTVTMECAFFGVPAVTFYKGSWITYQIARRVVTVKTFTMPNLLVGEEVYPEFLQSDFTSENISRAALELLQNESRRQKMKSQLEKVIASLGESGAANRAAAAILSLFK